MRVLEVRRGPKSASGKVRVRWLEGELEGYEDWVPWIRLKCEWSEAAALPMLGCHASILCPRPQRVGSARSAG